MPLQKGKKHLVSNFKELMHAYDRAGKIGHIKPKNRAKARKIAWAAAFNAAGR